MGKMFVILAVLCMVASSTPAAPVVQSASARQLWVAYYVHFTHQGQVETIQSRSLWTEGTDVIAHGGRWKFVFSPVFAQSSDSTGVLHLSVLPRNEPGTGRSDSGYFEREVAFQIGQQSEDRYSDRSCRESG